MDNKSHTLKKKVKKKPDSFYLAFPQNKMINKGARL